MASNCKSGLARITEDLAYTKWLIKSAGHVCIAVVVERSEVGVKRRQIAVIRFLRGFSLAQSTLISLPVHAEAVMTTLPPPIHVTNLSLKSLGSRNCVEDSRIGGLFRWSVEFRDKIS